MALYKKFLWGLLAGFAVICVKLVGPDSDHVRSLFIAGTSGDIAFYSLVCLVTVLLGGISGMFSKETDPTRMLVFCASFPALITTYSAPDRIPTTINADRPAETAMSAPGGFAFPGLIGRAQAGETGLGGPDGVCDEGSLVGQITDAARTYFSNRLEDSSYVVIIGSYPDYEEAKAMAQAFAAKSGDLPIYVGCRRPDNPYYPVIAGDRTDAETAAGIKGLITGEEWAPMETYISSYQYRVPIYVAD